jgi:signal transduction histidine kinase
LVRNAIKYVVEGTTNVRSVVVRVHEEAARVRVDVLDTGPGIPQDSTHRIFEPFVRGVATRQPGVGLGLATVKRLVEAYGGSVGVQSFDNRGSRFWFELPKAPHEALNAEMPALSRGSDQPEGPPFIGSGSAD